VVGNQFIHLPIKLGFRIANDAVPAVGNAAGA
jgi:hypothetical protein